MPISSTTLSDWLHREAHGGAAERTRYRRSTPRSPKIRSWENCRVPRPCTLCLSKEVSDTVIDVIVNGPVCSLSAAIAEVRGPATQKAVQFITRFRPRSDVAGSQEFTDFVLDPLHALRGWACTQVPTAVFPVAMWSERVSKKAETLPPSVLQRGFGLVDCEPEPSNARWIRMNSAQVVVRLRSGSGGIS